VPCAGSEGSSGGGSRHMAWQPIETAPTDGNAVLGYGRHTGSPPDAQRGVVAGDHWWAIMLWDIWRPSHTAPWHDSRWVFAKDGARTWSEPTHWMPLPEPPTDREAAASLPSSAPTP